MIIYLPFQTIRQETNRTEANIVISFSDEEGYDFIHGKVDLYDSYNLSSYDADSIIGGCSFLEYDEQEDKAYFNIDVTSEQPFDKEKLIFQVGQLLTNCGSEQKEIDLSNLIENPATKTVECNGYSWNSELSRLPSYLNPENESIPILDLSEIDKSMLHDLTITGTAYTDGILRIQTCRGILSDADRHLEMYLINSDGNQQCEDFSVGWQEEMNGELVWFSESWFLVDAEQLANSHMYGIYHTTDNQIVGDWKVTFRVE